MKVLKICQACDRILGEIDIDDLTSENADPIMDIVGNVAYDLCPACLHEMEVDRGNIYH